MATRPTLSVLFLFVSLHLASIRAHGGDENSSDGNLHASGLIAVKIWCLVIMLVTTFAGGISPYFFRWNEAFILLGTQFAGGVFLGTALMHFLADSNETFGDLTPKGYPFAFMLASSGYLLTMLGDTVIMYLTRNSTVGERRVEASEEGNREEEKSAVEVSPVFLQTTSVGDTILLIVALCFHSIFEGIAVGVAGII